MAMLPAVLGALISDGLSAISVPGASTAGEAVQIYLQRRSNIARDILLEEFRRAKIDPATAATRDDQVAAIYRYLRASWESSALVNLRLLAKAIVGRMRNNTLVADEFLPHADALAALSRDEIILLATMYRIHTSVDHDSTTTKAWLAAVQELEGKGWTNDHAQAVAGRAMRSGYVLAVSAWNALAFRLSPLLLDLCKTVDFEDALRREAQTDPP